MKQVIVTFLAAMSCTALADCPLTLPVQGVVSINKCDPEKQKCISAGKALHTYAEKADDNPDVLSISVHSSPWRFYDSEMRIITIEDMTGMARAHIKGPVKKVELAASWSGIRPDSKGKSLAQKLSESLNGFPVTGADGFLWMNKEGRSRTTRQAFTKLNFSGPYLVLDGDDVMASLVAGWYVSIEGFFVEQKNADGIMRTGAAWDIFSLCPDKALLAFEAAAKMSHPIAAYNAAVMRLDRGEKGDAKAAKALLAQAAKAGDEKSQRLLSKLNW